MLGGRVCNTEARTDVFNGSRSYHSPPRGGIGHCKDLCESSTLCINLPSSRSRLSTSRYTLPPHEPPQMSGALTFLTAGMMGTASSPWGIFKASLVVLVTFAIARSDGGKHKRPVFSGSVQENRPVGTKVNGINIHLNRISPEPWCSKVAGRKWHLQLIGEKGSHFEVYFHHRYAQMSLKTAQILDREEKSKYVFRLGLCCKLCLSPEHIVTELALVTVYVLDMNDNAPKFFSSNQSRISLDETTGLKSVVYSVRAEDPDQGTNADVVYFADPANSYFFVIPKTGQVVLVESILNLKKTINLTLFARDHGQPPLVSAPLQVEICPRVKKFSLPEKAEYALGLYRQKRSPELPESFTAISIPEDTPVTSVIITLVSRDFQDPWYELVSPSAEPSPIAVNGENGEVSVIRTLDREQADNYDCLVKVLDRAGKKSMCVYNVFNLCICCIHHSLSES